MRTILVMNSKGGSGKTTIATNIAVYYALRGRSVALVDFDQQASSADWLAARPANRPPIRGVEAWHANARIPSDVDYAIMDGQAGRHGRALSDLIRRAQTVVLPVLPSALDLRAAARFYEELLRVSKVTNNQVRIATVANRVREISPSRFVLEDFLTSLRLPDGRRLPFIALLRNTQNYVRAAERGLGIWEIAPSAAAYDWELWRPLMRWLNSKHSVPS
ncbi:MAG: ParA family protein [Gammaproteobacteria bacterium]|nr:ParA family protein [Gammaproteobacteria bacterium]NIR83671.1 ParA family protein [Gammaproteobacteria bacterium]NIR91646.1 ParA family protein [Gammaproteobacteria bacterium]NIU04833.1 ParA family protein [Gammaproteobacteria bacterium]NIV51819.1 AAA family ATPase [Gammaproteobacteria bacterium]